jgi:hypothetical protein
MLELRRLAGHDVRDLSEEGLERLSHSHITERDSYQTLQSDTWLRHTSTPASAH